MSDRGIEQRKADHLALVADGDVAFRRSSLLSCVELMHDALPELDTREVDLTTELAGKRLRAPLVIAGMTGGTDEAARLNKDLALVAQNAGVAFGLGSQRAMLVRPETAWTFEVRDVAPDVVLLANLGVVQAGQLAVAEVRKLCARVGADALCVHLNPGMELVQPGGDRDFRGALGTLARLRDGLELPIIVKETGCGLSPEVALRLRKLGITTVDVGGAGGTSWVGVETRRAEGAQRGIGEALWDWGVPTAVSVVGCARAGLETIATGGLRDGLDVARALALGARAAGLAAPLLKAHRDGGAAAAEALLGTLIETVRSVLVLTGCRRPDELARRPRVILPPLRDWLEQLGLWGPGGKIVPDVP